MDFNENVFAHFEELWNLRWSERCTRRLNVAIILAFGVKIFRYPIVTHLNTIQCILKLCKYHFDFEIFSEY